MYGWSAGPLSPARVIVGPVFRARTARATASQMKSSIAAVADGAGSAAMSDVGSALAADTSVNVAERLLREDSLSHSSPSPRDLPEARRRHAPLKKRDANCMRSPNAAKSMSGSWRPRCCWPFTHGTSWPPPRSGTAQWSCPTVQAQYGTFIAPQSGEYANQTNFLTSIGRHVHARRQGRAGERQLISAGHVY